MEQNLVKDVATLTTLGPQLTSKVFEAAKVCIEDYVYDALQVDEEVLEVDMGFGKLTFLLLEDSIKYRFEPSKKFEKELIRMYEGEESPIFKQLSDRLLKKLETAYKDIF